MFKEGSGERVGRSGWCSRRRKERVEHGRDKFFHRGGSTFRIVREPEFSDPTPNHSPLQVDVFVQSFVIRRLVFFDAEGCGISVVGISECKTSFLQMFHPRRQLLDQVWS